MQSRSIRISGVTSLALLLALTACRFPYGFAGGGLPPGLRTVTVMPFENRTTTPGLEREVMEAVAKDMSRLGLKEAPQGRADVIVTGRIVRYEVDQPIAFSADPRQTSGTRRRLDLAVEVEFTDEKNGRSIFKQTIPASGEYAESAESEGRREALTKLVNDIIQRVQNQW